MTDNNHNNIYENAESRVPSLSTWKNKYLKYIEGNASHSSLSTWETKYLKYKAKYHALKKKQYVMKGGSDKNTLYLFKAEWCHHCRMFKETWDFLQENMKGKINFIAYDSKENKDKMEKYKIEGFPTLKLQTKDGLIEYQGERNIDDIKNFIKEYSK